MSEILVVDDSVTQATVIASILHGHGVAVRTAANGLEALHALREKKSDLVVTDMQMPEMNGVELIRQMRREMPLVPAVLVTAYGNEDLAAEALGVGAANYISKDHIEILLPEIVGRVTEFGRANSESLDLKGALTRGSIEFLLDCSIERITPMVCLLLRMMAAMNVLHTGERIRIAEALSYLILHSIIHGNLGEPVLASPLGIDAAISLVEAKRQDESLRADTERNVTVQLDVGAREARFVVTHQGDGQSIHHAPLPGTPQSFSDERSRGMLLLTSVMDEVFIDSATGEVTLVKYI